MSDQQMNEFLTACNKFSQAMLVTVDKRQRLVGRPMFIASLETDGDLWFATDIASEKVDEILCNEQVCVTMAGSGAYVSISGRAKLVDDRATVHRLWSEPWRVWFPDGKDDPNLVLIKVEATDGEFWDNSGTNRIKYVFEAAKAYATGERPKLSDSSHGKVSL